MAESVLAVRGLSKLPLGLLGFFGVKNGGDYPQEIGRVIQTEFDIVGLLSAAYLERYVVQAAPALGTTQGTFTVGGLPAAVPSTETWALFCASFGLFTGVGDSVTAGPAIKNSQFGSASSWTRMLRDPITQGASLNTIYATNVAGQPLWLSPGDQFGFNCSAFVNASATSLLTLQIGIVRFLI